jgi:hypothetical protein
MRLSGRLLFFSCDMNVLLRKPLLREHQKQNHRTHGITHWTDVDRPTSTVNAHNLLLLPQRIHKATDKLQ